MGTPAPGSSREPIETLSLFERRWAVLLTTYRRDGRPVGTPVSIVRLGDRLAFRTYAESHKSQRLALDPRVTLAPSDFRGRPTGPAVAGEARLLEGRVDRQAARAIDRKYPVFQRVLVRLAHRLRRFHTVHFEIELGAGSTHEADG